MNIIVWNCRGALKPSFQSHIRELVRNHNPAMLVVMETRVGGDRAREITDRLPFDGAIHMDTIGYAGGLWLLWNSDRVEIIPLTSTEQEIHVMVKAKDKFGGRAVSVNRSLLFKECLDKCSMIDIGFSGPRFTWTNRREVQALIQERIDRVFVNPSWCLLYPEARVVHLTRCHSDHCPVMLQVLPKVQRRGNRPFKFQTCWLSDPSYPHVVNQAWRHSDALEEAIKHFKRDAINWNKVQFGNIFARKKNIMARLNGIQRTLSIRPSSFLLNLENALLKELDVVLNQEEELWALKSRVNWMIQGDRNTSFYHVSTLVRRKRNQIVAIKDATGEWLSEEDEVKEFIRNGFNEVYTTSLLSANKAAPERSQWQASLTEEEKTSISGVATEDEVKAALCTHIALIPKIQGPETLGNYRPISLCNTGYKIVTKIIVARLRPYLDKLISPLQAAFVPGRKGVDNAIIAQEVIHTLSKKRGRVGYMALKIDLEKAYDKLEWSFIRETLIRVNLPSDLIDIIMSCVSTVFTAVLFNGEAIDTIYPSRGIRQGDPLSPYLFILCMDFLGQLIEEKCSQNLWQPVKASRNGPAFSHLLFADDLVFFTKADSTNCSAIRDVLDDFCALSGQTVSEAKSRVYFSPNVDRDTRESLCDILGFASTPKLGKYLGFPIKQLGTSPQDYNFILDRLPGKILDGIDRVNRNFLWGSSDTVRKMHWIGWRKVTKPKEEGGLGLQTAKGRNIALLAKLNWRLATEKEALWAKVLRQKYCNQQRMNAANADRLPCSHVWAAVKKGREVFNKGSMWTVGRESNLSFWSGNWTKKGPLR
ncbi:hypothetical protein SO802_006213 [Lithocarpus litseifolius]|uniref:Reverse transcriptase domain-containing protein n=1 Tax=Lithocarpus litseifolius TaxID=425828 RepID=A0AAW2DP78_9ROSI